jgi:hypothetical protein
MSVMATDYYTTRNAPIFGRVFVGSSAALNYPLERRSRQALWHEAVG